MPKLRTQFTLGLALRWIFKEGQRELFVSDTNVEKYQTRPRIINDDVFHGKPKKQLFLGQTFHSNKAAVGEIGFNDAVEEDSVLVFRQARSVQENF